MPLADSMEKPPTAERAAGPIVVFSNSYARLPEHFFARLSPTAVAGPRLITFNESWTLLVHPTVRRQALAAAITSAQP